MHLVIYTRNQFKWHGLFLSNSTIHVSVKLKSCAINSVIMTIISCVEWVCLCHYSWFFGPLSREEANEKLEKGRNNGVFLVRESQSIKGDFVLVVK